MINFKPEEIFDLNIIGLWVTLFLAIIMIVTSLQPMYLLVVEIILLSYVYYLIKKIKNNKKAGIIINKQEKWFVEIEGEMYPVIQKDYWLLKQYIFLWVEGKQNSVSFVVTRSIIGPQRFSQLRAIIN